MERFSLKVLYAKVTNFGSYPELELRADTRGLTLVSGPTGSGKSTFCDIIPWILFGITSKNGSVDDILRWHTKEPTTGTITVCVNDKTMTIVRIRGSNKNNDLFLTLGTNAIGTRGKSLTDTQALINEELGFNAETYLAAVYFHEFSQTANFFSAPAKVRRAVIEEMVDLEFINNILTNTNELRKIVKSDLNSKATDLAVLGSHISSAQFYLNKAVSNKKSWDERQLNKIELTQKRYDNFENEKTLDIEQLEYIFKSKTEELRININTIEGSIQSPELIAARLVKTKIKIQELNTSNICKLCGTSNNTTKIMVLERDAYKLEQQLKDIETQRINLLKAQQELENHLSGVTRASINIREAKARQNTNLGYLKELRAENNPYTREIEETTTKLEDLKSESDSIKNTVAQLTVDNADILLLNDVLGNFRIELVKSTIIDLQNKTNNFLSKYFDAEIQVIFDLEKTDEIQVNIRKDGYSCSYSQLSKGQRQLLKLCFGVSVMQVIARTHAVNFDRIFLDEVFNGLDSDLVIKGARLLQSLEKDYDTVYFIEHNPDIKAYTSNIIEVSNINGTTSLNYG